MDRTKRNRHKEFSILQWNIGGMKANHTTLMSALQQESVDVIMLQETKLTIKDKKIFKLDGWKVHYCHAELEPQDPNQSIDPENNTSGNPTRYSQHGLIIAVKKQFPTKFIAKNTFGDNIESLTVKLILPDGPLTLNNVYIRPNTTLSDINHVSAPSENFITGGDFNAYNPIWDSSNGRNTLGSKVTDMLYNNSDMSLITKKCKTTVAKSNSPGHGVDLTFASVNYENKIEWAVLDNYISDVHYPIKLNIKAATWNDEDTFVPKFKLDQADWGLYRANIETNISKCDMKIFNTDNLNELTAALENIINNAAESSIPKTKFFKRPWACWFWNEQCSKARNEINYWTRKKKQGIVGAKEALSKAINDAKVIYTKSQNDKWEEICSSIILKDNTRESFQRIKNLERGSNYQPQRHEDPQERADNLIKDFTDRSKTSNLPINVKETLINLKEAREKFVKDNITIESPTDVPFTHQELSMALQYKKNTSPGSDKISYIMIKNLPEIARDILLKLINLSWSNMKLPTDWKTATIIAIPKPNSTGNRPISLLSCLDKIMERMVKDRFNFIFSGFNSNVLGFREGVGTGDNVILFAQLVSKHIRKTNFNYHKNTEAVSRANAQLTATSNPPDSVGNQPKDRQNFKSIWN